jgi:metal-sulfur cluster biosynthetic enzyme
METELDSERIWDALRTVLDPEVGMNIVELGLVYEVQVDGNFVHVRMTLTSAGCPMGAAMVDDARQALLRVLPSSAGTDVELVWDPPWTPSMMTLEARQALGWND